MRSILPRAIEAILFAAALLIPAAASAQEEARVTDVTETSDGYKCRALDMPELQLSHDWRGGDRSALWEGPAREANGSDMRVRLGFSPQVDRPTFAEPRLLGFELTMRTPLRAPAKLAHLRLDGSAQAAVLELQGSERYVSITVGERQRGDFGQRLMGTAIIEIDLVDALGTPLARYSWDVRRARRVNEVLQVINWSCH